MMKKTMLSAIDKPKLYYKKAKMAAMKKAKMAKMKKAEMAMAKPKFNAKLKSAAAQGKLDDNPNFKAAVMKAKLSEKKVARKKKAIERKKKNIVKKVKKKIEGKKVSDKFFKRKQGAILKKQQKINDYSQ